MRSVAAAVLAVTLLAAAAAAAAAAPARGDRLAPAESKWFRPVATTYDKLAAALAVVQKQELASGALIVGTTANHTLIDTLSVFVSCKTWLAQAGGAPTTRLQPFLASMDAACGHLYSGANEIAKAIGAIGKGKSAQAVALLKAGHAELAQGSSLLARAARQALAVGGKAAFTA